jgi:regulator of protease activity HflC (stomatin/prohibitin superfamily)
VRGLLVGAALVLAAWSGARWVERSFRSIAPGEAGLVVNRLTGKTAVAATGSHFLPAALYSLSTVRVSDQLLSGPPASFSVSTKDGFAVGLVLQARWALDRERLLSAYAGLPSNPGAEVVGPVLASSFRSFAPEYDAQALLASRREELASRATRQASERLKDSGIVLKDVLVSDLKLPPEFERGRLALLEQAQLVDRTEANLRFKKQEVEQQRLEAEARKARSDKEAEAAANRRLIEAKAESDAMAYVLPLKEKEIKQRELEAEAQKARRVKEAEGAAQTMKIQSEAEAARRRTLSEAEAYAIRQTSLAQFENLKREVELIERNPTWVNKTLAEKLGDKVQVIVMPNLTADILGKEAAKRVANGQTAVASRTE